MSRGNIVCILKVIAEYARPLGDVPGPPLPASLRVGPHHDAADSRRLL